MEKTSTKAPKPQVAPVEPPAPAFDAEREIARLRTVITDMQSMALTSVDQIAAIGKLALKALETPLSAPPDREMLALVIQAIVEKAQMTYDSVSYEAENLGIVHRDEAKERRAAAHRS